MGWNAARIPALHGSAACLLAEGCSPSFVGLKTKARFALSPVNPAPGASKHLVPKGTKLDAPGHRVLGALEGGGGDSHTGDSPLGSRGGAGEPRTASPWQAAVECASPEAFAAAAAPLRCCRAATPRGSRRACVEGG
jgi:hypothetical protein